MNKTNGILSLVFVFIFQILWSQANTTKKDSTYSPYQLLSSYYDTEFKPFKKRNVYLGMALSFEDRKVENANNIIETVLDGDRTNYDITLKGGYYIGNYAMAGIGANYNQNKFSGTVLRDSDTIQSKSITRGYAITPYFRSTVPLTSNERLSFYTELGVTFGGGNTLTRDIKNLDQIDKVYTTNFNFRIGLSPGITFFAMENFALEVGLDVLGYELNSSKTTKNDIEESSKVRQNVDFNINILSLNIGLAYYFGG